MVLAATQAAAEIEAASVLKAAAEAAAAEAKVAAKQTKAEVKAAKAKAKAEAEAIVTAKHSTYMKEKAAAEAAVIAEVTARVCTVAVAEEQCLDSKVLKEAVTADCVGRDATRRAFGLGHYPAIGSFDGGYVGALARAYVRLTEVEAYGACVNADGEFRSEKAQSTARETAQKQAEHMIYLQEKIRYLMQTHSEVVRRLSREMVRIRNDHSAAAAKDDRLSCAAYDDVLKFLSEPWVDVEATAASKDASIPRGPAEEALPADSAAAATVMSMLPMPAPKTRPRLQVFDSKEERYAAMYEADPSYKARHEAWLLAQWGDEDEDYGDDGGGGSSCSGGECESDYYTDDDRPDWMK